MILLCIGLDSISTIAVRSDVGVLDRDDEHGPISSIDIDFLQRSMEFCMELEQNVVILFVWLSLFSFGWQTDGSWRTEISREVLFFGPL